MSASDKRKPAVDREKKEYGLQATDEESASLFPPSILYHPRIRVGINRSVIAALDWGGPLTQFWLKSHFLALPHSLPTLKTKVKTKKSVYIAFFGGGASRGS